MNGTIRRIHLALPLTLLMTSCGGGSVATVKGALKTTEESTKAEAEENRKDVEAAEKKLGKDSPAAKLLRQGNGG